MLGSICRCRVSVNYASQNSVELHFIVTNRVTLLHKKKDFSLSVFVYSQQCFCRFDSKRDEHGRWLLKSWKKVPFFLLLSLPPFFFPSLWQSVCCLSISIVNAFFYVPGKINKMKEPLNPLRMAVAESASSGSATGKILLCCECPFSVCCTRF